MNNSTKTHDIHLVCNAHLDPVWLWEWEEGVAATISTFRTAADLCEEFEHFVFNHNEVILYEWVEQYEPALFKRIQKLVSDKKWHIMGGWYLQPDCNLPAGESFVRQILLGRHYFMEKFNVQPHTAINFDPFGHSRGLVQILAKSGYDSYLFCRPNPDYVTLPGEAFIWEGYDGSRILARRVSSHYNSPLGKAHEKVNKILAENPDADLDIILWGVGNHGGGPSRIDMEKLEQLITREKNHSIQHSTPEKYFSQLESKQTSLSVHTRDINPWAIGCYTSMARVKQKHRRLENELFLTEKMVATASLQNLVDYPKKELLQVQKDLATAQFHDILPGSSIPPVEEASLRLMDHGLEILSRIKAHAFFQLANGQSVARENEIPILIYNPHPYPIEDTIECEFNLAMDDRTGKFTLPVVYQGEKALPSQVEKERSNVPIDWRKRIVFRANLLPNQMNRFDCRLQLLDRPPSIEHQSRHEKLVFETEHLHVSIGLATGVMDRYCVGQSDYISRPGIHYQVLADSEDSWAHLDRRFGPSIGKFELMTPEQAADFAGIKAKRLDPVRIIEKGEVRTVVESLLIYHHSFICQRIAIPASGSEIKLDLFVYWNEKDRMLKCAIPTLLKDPEYTGQVAYGTGTLPDNGEEAVSQRWNMVRSKTDDQAISLINDGVYGSDFADQALRISLLRGPAYSALREKNEPATRQDRFIPRIDQGCRRFTFWLNAGSSKERIEQIDREAMSKNETPFALSFFPHAGGPKIEKMIELSDRVIQMTAFKQAEDGDGYIVRLFEPTGIARSTTLRMPGLQIAKSVRFAPFEIKTLRINIHDKNVIETDLMENPVQNYSK